MLEVTNISQFEESFEKYFEGVAELNNRVIIHGKKGSVVLMSLHDYEKIEKIDETEYLLGNPANKAMLEKSIKEFKEGKGITFSTQELEKLIRQLEQLDNNTN
jgi:PHD/YefM family antitoxin component YafN of YafNO toxin-antitoxin module